MKIRRITSRLATSKTYTELIKLLSQLRSKDTPGTPIELVRMAKNPNILMVGVWDGTRLVGYGSVYLIHKIGQCDAYIEEVIIDESYRGRHLGEALTKALIVEARKKKAHSIDLTSRPARVAANKLYQKLGFEKRETNVYRMKL